MRNLIYVNMMRLKKSRIFRAGVAVSMAYVAFLLFMNYQEMTDSPETVIDQLNWYFLSTLPVASAFCSVFCGMFLGTEYSDGTMRNKLMVGHIKKCLRHFNSPNPSLMRGIRGFFFYRFPA